MAKHKPHASVRQPLYTELVVFPLDHGGAVVSTPDPTLSFDNSLALISHSFRGSGGRWFESYPGYFLLGFSYAPFDVAA